MWREGERENAAVMTQTMGEQFEKCADNVDWIALRAPDMKTTLSARPQLLWNAFRVQTLRDSQVFEKDIHTFPNFEMYVECLKGGHYIIMTS